MLRVAPMIAQIVQTFCFLGEKGRKNCAGGGKTQLMIVPDAYS